ncbi:MAG: ribonuclease HII [Bdellovibrionales bacterium]|nr:ribonuclease HII [Bdellovibrionales bacterium]
MLKNWMSFKPQPVVGVDEVGRGCLAGPVVAGAVILKFPEDFKDSKSLTAKQREKATLQIKKNHFYAIGISSAKEIERFNIHKASLLAMKRAVNKLKIKSGHLLIDGSFKIPGLTQFTQSCFVKGDQIYSPISAASILAKTNRDQILSNYNKIYPYYGFNKHKGYPVPSHKSALKKYGPCPIHRKTFSGVKEYSHLLQTKATRS